MTGILGTNYALYSPKKDLYGLPTNDNHVIVEWLEPNTTVLFSFTQKGEALSCHYASKNNTFKQINKAMVDFVEFVKTTMPDITKLSALVLSQKVADRLVIVIGFDYICDVDIKTEDGEIKRCSLYELKI